MSEAVYYQIGAVLIGLACAVHISFFMGKAPKYNFEEES